MAQFLGVHHDNTLRWPLWKVDASMRKKNMVHFSLFNVFEEMQNMGTLSLISEACVYVWHLLLMYTNDWNEFLYPQSASEAHQSCTRHQARNKSVDCYVCVCTSCEGSPLQFRRMWIYLLGFSLSPQPKKKLLLSNDLYLSLETHWTRLLHI